MRTIGVIGAPSSAGAYAPGTGADPAGPARHRIAARSRRSRRRGQRPWRHAALALGPGSGVASRAERRRRRCHHRGGGRRGRRISGCRRAGTGAGRRLHGRPRRRASTGRDAGLRPAVPRHAQRHEHAREHARRRPRLDGCRAPARAGRPAPAPCPRSRSHRGRSRCSASRRARRRRGSTGRSPSLEIATTSAAALIANPGQAAAEALAVLPAGTDRVAVHFDVDVIDFVDAPLSQNTGRNVGVPMASALAALETLLADPRVATLTVTELNPAARRGGRLDAPGVQPRFVVSRGGLVDDLGGTTADPPSATRVDPSNVSNRARSVRAASPTCHESRQNVRIPVRQGERHLRPFRHGYVTLAARSASRAARPRRPELVAHAPATARPAAPPAPQQGPHHAEEHQRDHEEQRMAATAGRSPRSPRAAAAARATDATSRTGCAARRAVRGRGSRPAACRDRRSVFAARQRSSRCSNSSLSRRPATYWARRMPATASRSESPTRRWRSRGPWRS